VSQVLLEGARERAYDGLVIIAAPTVAAELEERLAPDTRALLIGNIVRDSLGLEPDMSCERQDIRH
jgi:protein required for attachment to host cells